MDLVYLRLAFPSNMIDLCSIMQEYVVYGCATFE
jgi:hypothetical protein